MYYYLKSHKFGFIPLHPTCHLNADFQVRKNTDPPGNCNSQRKTAVTGEKNGTITVTHSKCQRYPYLIPAILQALRVSL